MADWKNEPDEYFSWALSVALLSKGHLLVDILPDDNVLCRYSTEEQSLLGITFEGAIRYCIDSPNVTRLVCSPHCTPEHLYHAVSRPMKKFVSMKSSADVFEKSGDYGDNNNLNTGMAAVGNSRVARRKTFQHIQNGFLSSTQPETYTYGRSQSQQVNHNTLYSSRNSKYPNSSENMRLQEERMLEEGNLPYVFVVQDIDLLPRRTQMALLELMVTGVMPVKLVSMSAGSDPVLVSGATPLPKRFLVVALTTAVPEHTLDFDSVSLNSTTAASTKQKQNRSPSLLPALYDEFLLRIPLKLPPRDLLLSILRQKVHASGLGKQGTPISDYPTAYGFVEKAKAYSLHEKTRRWTAVAHYCLLWPSSLKVGNWSVMSSSIGKEATEEENGFSRVQRIVKDKLESQSLSVMRVHVSLAVKQQLRDVITALRTHHLVISGPSLQALQDLERAVRAVASSQHSSFVTPHHILSVVIESLAHRIVLLRKREDNGDSDSESNMNESEGRFMNSRNQSNLDQQANDSGQYKNPPEHWHSVTAARLIVAQVFEHYVPVQR